ncbi:hypothetical protein [Blastococcus sp. VKM Ac-2987]|uniref:hypothetical protein n=1 Tax=Blastococcus sp. VKM Ac-2987 TaxID=3004141 RepID=UPI0022ABC0B9|nr:hypothetical protein [Blastococcus sp. VKM Ac-2987]MCZ2860886.1 hypothetical protein [Blastococcus sp. VKM Ac-2987]
MTGDANGTSVPDAEVRAAAERWARAAGVPLATAQGSAPHRSPAPLRFLRGALLGAALGLLLLLMARGTGITAVLGVVLAVAVCVLAGRISAQRRQRAPGRTAPSRG